MSTSINYRQAVRDFHEARNKAEIQGIYSRLTGESNKLLSYEEVRQKLKAFEGNTTTLKEIPLDAIVGSVGRYTDFTRDFLPRRDTTQSRWTTVMEKALGLGGLPPIDVYQIGEAYFVVDGNHRVSVAKQLGADHIQAYVTQVLSRVSLSPGTQPDELIIKAEQTNFLEHTRIDELYPEADLNLTEAGQYPILEEHIAVHRYFMGVETQAEIPYEQAVTHWYEHGYLPVVELIRERGILERFPQRTETDLYLWLAKHRSRLQDALGWQLDDEVVAEDLVATYAQDFNQTISRLAARILDLVTPDPLESGPPTGQWRHIRAESGDPTILFEKILVALDGDQDRWYSLDQALVIAGHEDSQLRGLHIVPDAKEKDSNKIQTLQTAFAQRCALAGIQGELAVDTGKIARQICERAHWADLVVTQLAHPPGDKPAERLGSGFRTIVRRCSRPILAVPQNSTPMERVLLAYTDSPKAEEALYIGAYMAGKWGVSLTVLTVSQDTQNAAVLQEPAHAYLESHHIPAAFIRRDSGQMAATILEAADENGSDLILIGGYKASPLVEVFVGSNVDEVLRTTMVPVLICR